MLSCIYEDTPARGLELADDLHPVQPTVLRDIHDEPPSSSSGFKGRPIFDSSARFTARTSSAPTGVAENATTGQKCIFHWLSCSFQANDFGNWQKHIERHIVGVNWGEQSNLKLAGMPNSWNCSFGCDFRIEEGHDPKSIWEVKLRHIYQHILDGNPVEDLNEGAAWMEYYHEYVGIQKQAVPAQSRNFNIQKETIPLASTKRPKVYRPRKTLTYLCKEYFETGCNQRFSSRFILKSHINRAHNTQAYVCPSPRCSHRCGMLLKMDYHTKQYCGIPVDTTTNLSKSAALTELIEPKRLRCHIHTKPIPTFNDTETSRNQRETVALEMSIFNTPSKLISGSPLSADSISAIQADECTKKEIQSPGDQFELIHNKDTSLRVDSSSGTGEPERDGRSPQMEILGPNSFDTSESPGEAGANQKSSTMVPDHIRATNHRTVKEMTTETLGNQLLRETAARVRAYALQTVAKILHQQFAGCSLRFINPSAATDAEESSSGGELVASTEPGSLTPLQTVEPGQGRSICNKRKAPSQQEGEGADDDDEEDEDNRKKRPRMSKSGLCTPRVRRYACIYFANAMDSKVSQFLNVDLTRWQIECYRSGFENVTRVKSHLYSHHQWGCKKCYRNFPTAEAHYDHSHGDCQESTETAPVFLSRDQISRLKSKKPVPGVDTEEKKWRSIFRLVFPDRENIPSPYWEAISLNCKRQHIDPSQLLNLLKRQFETALLTKELLKPLDQALLGLKIVWGKVVDAITENYPISENLNDMDMASWKTIFEDIVENTVRSNTRNGESDPTPSLVNSTNSASESTSEAAYESFQGTVSPTIPESTIPKLLSGSLFGFDKPQFNELPTWTEPWKFNPFTGEPLGGNSAYLDETPVEWLSQELSQFINSGNLNKTEAE